MAKVNIVDKSGWDNLEKRFSTGEFGSLEDNSGVKRVSPQEIRKMRVTAQRQSSWRFALVRAITRAVDNLVSLVKSIGAKKRRSYSYCEINGHLAAKVGLGQFAPRCRFCGKEIKNANELSSVQPAFDNQD